MGRHDDLPENSQVIRKLYLRDIMRRGEDGVYDENGGYWGSDRSGRSVFWAHAPERERIDRRRAGSHEYEYRRSESEWMEINMFVRAYNREDAKNSILLRFPKMTFYR